MTTIILLALAGALIASVVGTFWYMPNTPMGKIHMKYLGFDKLSPEEQKRKMEEAKPNMWKMYVSQMILSAITAFAVVYIITQGTQSGLSFMMSLGFIIMNWLCFIVPTIGSGILWSNCDRSLAWKKFFSDIASSLVTIVLISLLAKLFQ